MAECNGSSGFGQPSGDRTMNHISQTSVQHDDSFRTLVAEWSCLPLAAGTRRGQTDEQDVEKKESECSHDEGKS